MAGGRVGEDAEAADASTPLNRDRGDSADSNAEDTCEERERRAPHPPCLHHRAAVEELPDLRDRIAKMGLTSEYEAFRERYMAWRKGEARGARGGIAQLRQQDCGFGYWYPSVEEWKWKRTLSYWIAVTFFEGSIFFTISSFMYNYEDVLGHYYFAVTTGGYIAGKINFLICTYLMCIETVNLHAVGHAPDGASSEESGESSGSDATGDSSGNTAAAKPQGFYLWPFYFRQAINNLAKVGVGPWPYWASVMYLMGVLIFGVGLVVEFVDLPHDIGEELNRWLFLFGSMGFLLGGVAECIENETFTSLSVTKGWLGALFNTLGGVGFVIGAVYGWIDVYWSNMWYGIGSVIFVVGSSVMIIMWKDEQFGLTFLAVLNKLGGPQGRPMLDRDEEEAPKEAHFSPWGVIFIHVYCLAGALSIYNFNLELTLATLRKLQVWRSFQNAFNQFLPFVFCHMVLALTSAVVRMPKVAPYRQLLIGIRFLALVVLANSASEFLAFVCQMIHVKLQV